MADRYPATDAPELVEPLDQHRIDTARLAGWLSNHVPAAAQGLEVQQFQGGMSNPTYLIRVADGQRFVIRKKPPGKLLPKAHQIDREYKVMDALAGTGVPVPKMIALCEEQPPNTLLTVSRDLTEAGVKESYGLIEPQDAGIEQFAVHGSRDEDPHQH